MMLIKMRKTRTIRRLVPSPHIIQQIYSDHSRIAIGMMQQSQSIEKLIFIYGYHLSSIQNFHAHFYIMFRPVSITSRDRLYSIQDIKTFDHLSENRIITVQMRRSSDCRIGLLLIGRKTYSSIFLHNLFRFFYEIIL